MNSLIQILDTQAANQIAAGEVVERPVSVVKELVENALDAEAKHIEITIEGSGVQLIRIRDDGRGIMPEDLPKAVLRHATSKIRSIADLNNLRTLGFRGEALPSIASVAKLEIISRPKDEISGMLLRLEGGLQTESQEIGSPPGTTVTVEELFFNTPARRKFMKSNSTEYGQISDLISRLALAHPEVAFTLKHPQTVVFQTSGQGKLLESIASVYGHDTARRLIPVAFSRLDWIVEGYISPPDLARSSRNAETLIVNGRIIRSKLISRAIAEGYHTLLPAKLFPMTILNFKLPPSEYDVNVHPTKMEIRFQREKELGEFIAQGLRQALLSSKAIVPSAIVSKPKSLSTPKTGVASSTYPETVPASFFKPADTTVRPKQYSLLFGRAASSADQRVQINPTPQYTNSTKMPMQTQVAEAVAKVGFEKAVLNIGAFTETQQADGVLGAIDEVPVFSDGSNDENISELADGQSSTCFEASAESPSTEPFNSQLLAGENEFPITELTLQEQFFLSLRPIGQVFNTYILATDGEQLVLIDQHAAHERINYEHLLEKHRNAPGVSQSLLIPLPLELTPSEEQALLEFMLPLHDMGFILEEFGVRTYLLRAIPASSSLDYAEQILRNFLDLVLLKQIAPSYDRLLQEWIYQLACKASIKAKEKLSLAEMEQLLNRLSQTDNPYTCPHGRPTVVKITRRELEDRFYRS